MEIKFGIDERVRVKTTGRIGTIQSFRVDGSKINGKNTVVVTYIVKYKDYNYTDIYKEDQLETAVDHNYNFDDTFENGLATMLIDIYLLHNKLDLVRLLSSSYRA